MEIIDHAQNGEYVGKLRELLLSAQRWGAGLFGFDLEVAQQEFMTQVTDLYLGYFRYHIEEARVIAFEYEASLLSVFDCINQDYLETMAYKLDHVDPEESIWLFVCTVKTNVEAYNELFSHITGKLDDRPFEDFLEERRNSGYADIIPTDIPRNVPKEHWWWYA